MSLLKPKTPVIFLAYANERSEDGFLRKLIFELKSVMNALEFAVQKESVALKIVPAVSQDEVVEVLQDPWYEKRIQIFHYGGHADNDELWFEADSGASNQRFGSAGLAKLLGAQNSIKLVFLNGCATHDHVKLLKEAGIPVVIATSRKINDAQATKFATIFYKGLAGGSSIEEAFQEAEGIILGEYGTRAFAKPEGSRSLFWEEDKDKESDTMDLPWQLHLKEGAEMLGTQWRLFYEEGNNTSVDTEAVSPESFIGETISNYEIKEVLGQGALGIVFKAVHTSLNETRAIKVSHRVLEGYDEFKDVILAGFKGLNSIQHPNIVKLYDAGEVSLFGEKRIYMVMEMVEGQRLDKIDFVKVLYKKSDLTNFLNVVLDVMSGMAKAHNTRFEDANGMPREGIVHGNLKTRKILLNPDGIPKIIDFLFTDLTRSRKIKLDIPKEVQASRRAERLEDYFAPEVISGRSSVNKLTDIYSMGTILFELVSGRKFGDFSFKDDDEIFRLVKKAVPFFPKRISKVIFKATQEAPQDRYLQVEDMIEDMLQSTTFVQRIWHGYIKNIWYSLRRK